MRLKPYYMDDSTRDAPCEINITAATIAKMIPINFFRVDGLRRFVYLAPRNPPTIAEGPKIIK